MWIVRDSLIDLRNGLRAMLISDRPANHDDDDDDNAADDIRDNKRHKRRTSRRDTTSDDNIMQVSVAYAKACHS